MCVLVCVVPVKASRGHESHGAGVIGACKSPVWELRPDEPVPSVKVLLIAEPVSPPIAI